MCVCNILFKIMFSAFFRHFLKNINSFVHLLKTFSYTEFKVLFRFKRLGSKRKKRFESARGRTWNLRLRRQTRYPLRHKPVAECDNVNIFKSSS